MKQAAPRQAPSKEVTMKEVAAHAGVALSSVRECSMTIPM